MPTDRASGAYRPHWPDTWVKTQRGGYGFTLRVPCRVVGETAKCLKIAVLQGPHGGEVVRTVPREKVLRGE